MKKRNAILLVILSFFLILPLSAADWPRWRGSRGDGVYRGNDISIDTLKKELKKTWEISLGSGYSAPSIKGDKLYIMGNKKRNDVVYCLNALTGKEIWSYSYKCNTGGYPGPRATPYIEGKFIYTMSREGHIFCFNADTGKVVWQKHLINDFGATPPKWGFAGSPIISGNMVLYNANTGGLGLNKKNGALVWTSPKGLGGYSTPVIFSRGSSREVLLFSAKNLVSVDIKNGKKKWEYPWVTSYDVNASDPLVIKNRVFISSGYGKGGVLLDLSGNSPVKVWQNKNMRTHFSSFLHKEGYIYGSDGNSGSRSSLRCIEVSSGKIIWEEKFSMGSLTGINDEFFIFYTERGEVITAQLTPKGYSELSRSKPYRGSTTWTAPVIANGKLYLRDDRGMLYCFNIGK